MARNSHPCDPLSRWRKYAFSRKEGDEGVNNAQLFEAVYNSTTDNYITIKLNGHVRTVVKSLAFEDGSDYQLEFNIVYEMCDEPEEYVDGESRRLSTRMLYFFVLPGLVDYTL